MYYKTKGYKVFTAINYFILGIVSLTCILPLINLMAVSFSGKAAASANLVYFWPVGFNITAYETTFRNVNFFHSLWISIVRTSLGTLLSMALITTAGYALSKDFKGRNFYMWFFVFTMLFSGGLIPSYILITTLKLKDNIGALILPGAFGVFNLILIMNFFKTIPKSLEEAALIDGASFFTVFLRIYLPLSLPGLATISLFIMVGHWNSWFDGILYMSSTAKYPLASFLQTVVIQSNMQDLSINSETAANLSQRTIKAAQIFIGALPILLVYPFLQKYFVKGIVMGAVKE